MRPHLRRVLTPFVLSMMAACSGTCATPAAPGTPQGDGGSATQVALDKASRKKLVPFASEDDFKSFVSEMAKAGRRDRAGAVSASAAPAATAAAEDAPAKDEGKADKADDAITNTQHAGVDEGGIVKMHGDHLVVLRRGRLFTVKVGDDSLAPVSTIDAFGPGIDPSGAWYDEMLVSGDRVMVVGYSYQRGGTEIGVFDVDREGKLSYRATYHLRSNDYYSSRNYASRIVGSKLIFYSPSYLALDEKNPMRSFPAVRKWHTGASDAEFQRVLSPTRLYRPVEGISGMALHTVTTCDLDKPDLPCTATGVLGAPGRVFYVSPNAVYVWMTEWKYRQDLQRSDALSAVVRLPLDGGAPTAMRTSGSPVDQFSFNEEGGHLDVLVRSEANGDAMWAPESSAGDVALMRVPLAAFSDDIPEVRASAYARLPRPKGYSMQNRFVGDYVLYGSGDAWGYGQPQQEKKVFAYRYAAGGDARTLELSHPVDRIEALGKDAVIVGGDGKDLRFTSVSLSGAPSVAGTYVRHGAAQGETRSHGFFYKPESDKEGMLGLPIRSAGRPGAAHLVEGSASVLFLRNERLDLREIGELEASAHTGTNDACKASCVDWYGNARPIFWRGRVFALMGYEIVEGRVTGERSRIEERRRITFAPQAR